MAVQSAEEFPLASVVSVLGWPDTLLMASTLGGRVASHSSATCFPFLLGCPEDVVAMLSRNKLTRKDATDNGAQFFYTGGSKVEFPL